MHVIEWIIDMQTAVAHLICTCVVHMVRGIYTAVIPTLMVVLQNLIRFVMDVSWCCMTQLHAASMSCLRGAAPRLTETLPTVTRLIVHTLWGFAIQLPMPLVTAVITLALVSLVGWYWRFCGQATQTVLREASLMPPATTTVCPPAGCCVCLGDEAVMVIVPCGHLCLCQVW